MPHSLLKTSVPSTTTTKGKNSRSTASQLTLLTGPHPAQCQPRLPHHHCLPLTPFKNQQTQLLGLCTCSITKVPLVTSLRFFPLTCSCPLPSLGSFQPNPRILCSNRTSFKKTFLVFHNSFVLLHAYVHKHIGTGIILFMRENKTRDSECATMGGPGKNHRACTGWYSMQPLKRIRRAVSHTYENSKTKIKKQPPQSKAKWNEDCCWVAG